MARPKKKAKTPEEQIQEIICGIVVDSEYTVAAANNTSDNLEFESLIDMLELRRTEKDYDWMSDHYIPEMNSILLTESSIWANQYFQSRDFVEVKLDGETEEDKDKAEAAKKLINKTLNNRDLFYYQKYIRLRTINALRGHCYIVGWWQKNIKKAMVPSLRTAHTGFDDYGQPIFGQVEVQNEVKTILDDKFNFEVVDPRNVFTDNKYAYTIQQKDWVIIRSEGTYSDLKAKEKENNYFNLDKVKEAIKSSSTTKTKEESYGKDQDGQDIDKTPVKYIDILDRYGKFWAVVTERDQYYNPTACKPGFDQFGNPTDDAELVEMILTFVVAGNSKILIRFEPTSYIDAKGNPYKPIVRGTCYIHPVKDEGLSDGKNMRELQIAINDNHNMGVDRVKLATLPTFKGKKNSLDDNSTVYIEPEHVIELEDVNDLQELQIRDNITGSIEMDNKLVSKLQQVSAIYPNTMGDTGMASTTATAIAGAEVRTNARSNYKSLTFEYTFFVEFYWLILQMAYRFAEDETLIDMLGEEAQYFDANANYTYSPVSSNIETEFNKNKKISLYDQTLGRISGLVPILPELVPVIAHVIGRQLELQGDEYQDIGEMIEKLAKAKVQPKPEGGEVPQQMPNMQMPESNQNGITMTPMERTVREASMPMGGQI